MRRFRDRHRVAWGAVSALVVVGQSGGLSGAVEFVLVLAAIVLGGFLGGEAYAWTWRLRARAWVAEATAPGAGLATYPDKNWGPLWRQLSRRISDSNRG